MGCTWGRQVTEQISSMRPDCLEHWSPESDCWVAGVHRARMDESCTFQLCKAVPLRWLVKVHILMYSRTVASHQHRMGSRRCRPILGHHLGAGQYVPALRAQLACTDGRRRARWQAPTYSPQTHSSGVYIECTCIWTRARKAPGAGRKAWQGLFHTGMHLDVVCAGGRKPGAASASSSHVSPCRVLPPGHGGEDAVVDQVPVCIPTVADRDPSRDAAEPLTGSVGRPLQHCRRAWGGPASLCFGVRPSDAGSPKLAHINPCTRTQRQPHSRKHIGSSACPGRGLLTFRPVLAAKLPTSQTSNLALPRAIRSHVAGATPVGPRLPRLAS